MKNMIYKNFTKTDKQLLAQQIASSYIYGLIDAHPPQNVTEARTAHTKNIEGLERSVVIFKSMPNSHIMINNLNEQLVQERLWLKHFEKCALEHNRARGDLLRKDDKAKPEKKKGFWAKLFDTSDISTDPLKLDPKEKRRNELAKARMVALAAELEVLAEVELAATVAEETRAKLKQQEEKRKQEENNKNKNNNNNKQQQRSAADTARESRRRFLQESDGNEKKDTKEDGNKDRSVEKETA